MHQVVVESLEEYLSGTLNPAVLRAFETHLSSCSDCREEVHGIEDVAQMFGCLRSTEPPEPAAGFCARVIERVGRGQPASVFARVFGLDLVLARRLAFASLLVLAALGGYLVTHETIYPAEPSPEAILAQQEWPAFQTARAEDNMLVTLTAYEH
jgi:anti-sigma factor RsiW